MTAEYVCVRCAELGPTCCRLSAEDAEFCFPLADADRNRLSALGSAAESFLAGPNTPAFIRQLTALLPGYGVRTFTLDTRHWRLRTTSDGACVFLGSSGCALERDMRPTYCRLFPLWVYQGRLTWFTSETCLAHRECASVPAMLQAMKTDAEEVRALFQQMCDDLGLEPTGKRR